MAIERRRKVECHPALKLEMTPGDGRHDPRDADTPSSDQRPMRLTTLEEGKFLFELFSAVSCSTRSST
jgi:hypothetical protein